MAHDSDGHDRSQPRQGGQEQARQPRTSRAGSETRDQASDDRDAPVPGDDYTRQLRDRYGHGDGGHDRDAYRQGGYGGSPEDRGVQTAGGRADGDMAVAQNRPFSEARGDLTRGVTGLYQGGEDQPRHTGGRHQTGNEAWRDGEPRRGGFRGHGPKGYRRSDERVTEDLCERLSEDDEVDASNISVEVRDGVATLTGSVPDRRMKHRAEDIAEHCSGVDDIDNRIRVVRQGDSAAMRQHQDR